jgi:hypothetical protein
MRSTVPPPLDTTVLIALALACPILPRSQGGGRVGIGRSLGLVPQEFLYGVGTHSTDTF